MRLKRGELYRRLVPLPDDLPAARRMVLGRIEAGVWCSVLVTVMVTCAAHFLIGRATDGITAAAAWHIVAAFGPGVPATVLILRFAFARSVEHARQDARLNEAEARAARLDGALLMARTAAHELNNALMPISGFAELLASRPAVAADAQARAFAGLIAGGAADMTLRVRALQQIVRIAEAEFEPAGVPVLDLARSTHPEGEGRERGRITPAGTSAPAPALTLA